MSCGDSSRGIVEVEEEEVAFGHGSEILTYILIFWVKMIEELVKGGRNQRTDYKQVVEVGMVCRKVRRFQRLEEILV